ncbi:MAG: hypothetical protein JHD15_19440 [Phenylobacterium sp.]|uniref:hypothetical protein n=1 Tax=Phenylobacterium sp. TaxID=1871053 RepID=UPI001A1845CB|nr:hypothetical protein [Phenylobacterium sp.]MBJ7412513.1 hypothetical protein [Phenylobacterium sp.]
MKHVISKTEATLARRATAWRPELYEHVSPTLRSLLQAELTARALCREARDEGRKLRDQANATPLPTNAEISAARDAVPVPDILRAPASERQIASVTWSDGSVTACPEPSPRGLSPMEIDERYADDPAMLAEARQAYAQWQRACQRATRNLFSSRRSPEAEAAKKAADRHYRTTISPAFDAWEAAKAALRNFQAVTPEDRLAQIVTLFELERGTISRSGKARNAEDAFEGPDGDKLATLVFAALADAADRSTSGQVSDGAVWDHWARQSSMIAAE